MIDDLVQGSEEWRLARVGSLGASRLHEAIARTKTGYGASRANLMAELICERLTGQPAEKFVTQAMQHGTDTEPEARNAYCFYSGNVVEEIGLIRHPTIEGSHASPDGLIGDDGGLEVKCPQPAAHLETLLGQEIPAKYVTQMMWFMACSGRKWVDFVSYSPSLPESMRIFVKRLHRDEGRIIELESEVATFLVELETKLALLGRIYGEKEGGMIDRVTTIAGDWALASDGVQWILMRRRTRKAGPYWQPVSFVRSQKDILARCMREKGVDEDTAVILLSWLPDTFDEFKATHLAQERVPLCPAKQGEAG